MPLKNLAQLLMELNIIMHFSAMIVEDTQGCDRQKFCTATSISKTPPGPELELGNTHSPPHPRSKRTLCNIFSEPYSAQLLHMQFFGKGGYRPAHARGTIYIHLSFFSTSGHRSLRSAGLAIFGQGRKQRA